MAFKISEQPNVFDDHFLDVIGNEFKFDHVKGLAEWAKNSADAYTREGVPDEDQHIIMRFAPKEGKSEARFECIDFVGMTRDDIDKAFKRWGDPKAAGRGAGRRVLGGHGNGGKFYMRQMFKTSHFVTYRDGKLSVFGFNERKRYGFAEGFEDKKISLDDALVFAGIGRDLIQDTVRRRWKASKGGFTVVRGEGPEKLKSWAKTVESVSSRLRIHPQSRRLIKHKQVMIDVGSGPIRLEPESIAPKPDFPGPYTFEIPAEIELDGQKFALRNEKYPEARLTIYTAAQPFGHAGDRASLNSIDILGEVGCIGSYRLNELGYLRHAPQAEFLYGECLCPILEDPADDCVRNDREKLVETDKTKALLAWIRKMVDDLCEKMVEKEKAERKDVALRQSSALNDLLNRWKNKFMSKLFAEVLGGPGRGQSWGGLDGGGEGGKAGKKGGGGDGLKGGTDGKGGGGAGNDQKRAPRFPRVLLSSIDPDPLMPPPQETLHLDPRNAAVHQRPEDVNEGIYWINTSRPLSQRIIEQYTVKSTRWREYLFQRYVDVIVKEGLFQLAKREIGFTVDSVDSMIDDVIRRVHDAAAEDLEAFLFEEGFVAPK